MPNNIYNNLSQDELKVSYWYVTHRILLRKIGIMLLAVVSGVLLLYGIYGLINFYLLGGKENVSIEKALSTGALNYNLLAEANKPKELAVLDTTILKGAGRAYDIISEVSNPNLQWAVESFDYYYLIGEEKTNVKTDFILPNSSKYVLHLNYENDAGAAEANLVIENIKWKKISDYELLAEKILQFDFENKIILFSKSGGLSEKESVTNIRFDVLNKSAYNFWEPRFIVLLLRGDALATVTQVVVDGLASGEKKTESINLFQTIPSGARLEIIPDVNILDPNVFKGFEQGLAR